MPEYRTKSDFVAQRELHQTILDYALRFCDIDWSVVGISIPNFNNSCTLYHAYGAFGRVKKLMLSEKEYVIKSFEKHFGKYTGVPVAIYGIGKNTRYIIESFPKHNIAGLMDEVRVGETIYGVPVISFDEAVTQGIKTVIIIARASNTKIIYRRIEKQANEYAIEVFDINGNKLGGGQQTEKSFAKYQEISEAVLKAKIEQADVVSFDIFDTLIMRKCLYPRDIFYLIGEDFAKERIKSEMDLYAQGKHPTIYDIYSNMDGDYSPITEIELEQLYLTTRDAVVDILNYSVSVNKKVFLTSDMYLPKEIVYDILGGLGVNINIDNILVSCDYGKSKHDGLFDVLRQKSGGNRILHIGDNFEADTVSAGQYGIEPFSIESAAGMLDDSFGDKLLQYAGNMQERLIVGDFITRQLNNPFLFGKTRGKFETNSNYEMAYSFVAPIIVRFFFYLIDRAKELRLELVLLASRDGYIIEKIYQIFKEKHDLPPMKYFYASRAVCTVAGLIDDVDIVHAAQLAFAGTPEEMLKERFHLQDSEIMKRVDGESDEDYVLKHKAAILKVAGREREKYLRYIGKFDIKAGVKVGFFDFVSSGTCQKALCNIVDFDLFGLYMAAINYATDYKGDTSIDAMYGVINVFEKSYDILENYFFMENIMSSKEATLSGFDDDGMPLFLPEYRTKSDFAALDEIHQAIIDYTVKFCDREWTAVDISLPDCIFGLLNSKYTNINTSFFAGGKLRDEFCKREFVL